MTKDRESQLIVKNQKLESQVKGERAQDTRETVVLDQITVLEQRRSFRSQSRKMSRKLGRKMSRVQIQGSMKTQEDEDESSPKQNDEKKTEEVPITDNDVISSGRLRLKQRRLPMLKRSGSSGHLDKPQQDNFVGSNADFESEEPLVGNPLIKIPRRGAAKSYFNDAPSPSTRLQMANDMDYFSTKNTGVVEAPRSDLKQLLTIHEKEAKFKPLLIRKHPVLSIICVYSMRYSRASRVMVFYCLRLGQLMIIGTFYNATTSSNDQTKSSPSFWDILLQFSVEDLYVAILSTIILVPVGILMARLHKRQRIPLDKPIGEQMRVYDRNIHQIRIAIAVCTIWSLFCLYMIAIYASSFESEDSYRWSITWIFAVIYSISLNIGFKVLLHLSWKWIKSKRARDGL